MASAAQELAISTDEDTTLGTLRVADHEIAETDLAGFWAKAAATMTDALPKGANIDAVDVVGDNDVYFSLDVAATLGAVSAANEDVVHWDGAAFSIAWDGSAQGLAGGVNLDALVIIRPSPLELSVSLDVPAELPGVGRVESGDAVRFVTGKGFVALDFDASAAGLSEALDLDALARHSFTEWLLSFDAPGQVGGLVFDDADLVLWDDKAQTFNPAPWLVAASHGMVPGVDLDAADELGFAPADLSLTKVSPQSAYDPGTSVTYTITVSNAGPFDAVDGRVTDPFPGELSDVSWTCSGSVGGDCSANGTGDIDDRIFLRVGSVVTYEISALIDAGAGSDLLVNTAEVAPVPSGIDPELNDNVATHVDRLGTVLFCSGFEDGDLEDWSSSVP